MEEMRGKQALIDKLTHEMAILKRLKFAASSEAYSGEQQRMLFETLDTDIEALTAEIEQLTPTKPAGDDGKKQPKRAPLPAALPRKEIRHDPDSTVCGCGCGCQLQRIGEDVAEKLDYQPGVLTVERHIRGKSDGSATARAIDYSLGRWSPLTHYLDDGAVPIDNNWVENQIRPNALGKRNWLFAGSLRAGRRAAAVMILLHSARLNGHDVHAYMTDILERLPTLPASRISDLFPHHWTPA